MKIWKQLLWPFLSKFTKYIFTIFEATAKEVAKQIPAMLLESIQAKMKEVSGLDLTGQAKMKIVGDYAKDLLKSEGKNIGQSLLDTFLQNVYQDLKNRAIVK